MNKIKTPYILIVIFFVFTIYFFSSDYLSLKLPGSLWDLSPQKEKDNLSEEVIQTIVVQKGDSLIAILNRQDIISSDINKIVQLAKKEKTALKLQIGQTINFYYNIELVEQAESELVTENMVLDKLSIQTGKHNYTEFVRENDNFTIKLITKPLQKLLTRYDAVIESSLLASLKKAGMSTNSTIQLINAYSYQLDLQREIRNGDKITVIVEKFVTDEGKFSHHGRIIHALLTSKGKDYNIYSYSKNNNYSFFNEKGLSIKGTLLRTPVDVVRISSHFGYRKKHPVLGYGAMHKGVDFAASTGTPIYSSGNGVISFIGVQKGYGKIIIIKHNSTLSTAYAHASKFTKNLKKGNKVKQGQIIAYVGQTGYATGPHLHYEVRVNGKQVNPIKFKSSAGIKLSGKDLANFKLFKNNLNKIHKDLIQKNNLSADKLKVS